MLVVGTTWVCTNKYRSNMFCKLNYIFSVFHTCSERHLLPLYNVLMTYLLAKFELHCHQSNSTHEIHSSNTAFIAIYCLDLPEKLLLCLLCFHRTIPLCLALTLICDVIQLSKSIFILNIFVVRKPNNAV